MYRNRRPRKGDRGTTTREAGKPERQPGSRNTAEGRAAEPGSRPRAAEKAGDGPNALPGEEGRAATEAGAARRTAKADRKPGGTEAPDGAEPLPRPHRTADATIKDQDYI